MPDPLPPTAAEIQAIVERIEKRLLALEGKPDGKAEIDALKAELAELKKASAAKPERKRDRWGWPTE